MSGHDAATGSGRDGRTIRTTPCGYLIEVRPDDLDLGRFRRLVDHAARSGSPAELVDLLGRALTLWRGQPLADVTTEALLRISVPRLHEERLHALERWIDARLAVGTSTGSFRS